VTSTVDPQPVRKCAVRKIFFREVIVFGRYFRLRAAGSKRTQTMTKPWSTKARRHSHNLTGERNEPALHNRLLLNLCCHLDPTGRLPTPHRHRESFNWEDRCAGVQPGPDSVRSLGGSTKGDGQDFPCSRSRDPLARMSLLGGVCFNEPDDQDHPATL
jgi:hypothetical protein